MKNKALHIKPLSYLLLMLMPLAALAGYASYGNDYLHLLKGPGGELYGTAYGLMQFGAENAFINPARLESATAKPLYLYHSTWFRNEVSASSLGYTFHYKDKPLGLMVSRIAVSDIPDTRNALLDFGLDGMPGTGDAGEGNGILDENEIIDYDGIQFTGIANYTLHLGVPLAEIGKFRLGAAFGLLYTDLIAAKGYGLTLNLYAQHSGKHVNALYVIKNLPSALMVFNSGSAQYYYPQVSAAWLAPLSVGDFQFLPGVSAGLSIAEDLDDAAFRLGSALALDIQPLLRVRYRNVLAAGISYRHGEGFHAGLDVSMPLLDISYSFRPSSGGELGGSHLIALRLSVDIFK